MLILGIDPGTRILGYSLLAVNETSTPAEPYPRSPEVSMSRSPEDSMSRSLEDSMSRSLEVPKSQCLEVSMSRSLEVSKSRSLEVSKSRSLEIIAMDVLYLKQIADFNMRIRRIFDTTLRIIDGYHPDHLAIEAPFFGKNVQSMLKLGRAQGVAIAAAMCRDLSFTEYEPATIKQLVTGNGNASKEQVATMLRSILGFDDSPRYLDATDALAVAYTCHMQLSNPLADLREQLIPKKKNHKSAKKQWSEFVTQNPDRVL